MMTFAEHYVNLVGKIMSEDADYMFNDRTRSGISFLSEGCSFYINLADNILPTCGLRRTKPFIAAAEVAWCFMGLTSTEWLNKHTKIWDQFTDANGNVMEAYGHRWKHAFGFDQISTAIQRLVVDPSDRRVWISSWDPRHDLTSSGQKTVPCPVGFTLSVYNNHLNSTFIIRSSDVFIGLPLDIMRHALVMRAVANSISEKMQLGYMHVTLAHPHIYESHWDFVEVMLNEPINIPYILMPVLPWTVDKIARFPDEYVQLVRDMAFGANPWPCFDPKVAVVK